MNLERTTLQDSQPSDIQWQVRKGDLGVLKEVASESWDTYRQRVADAAQVSDVVFSFNRTLFRVKKGESLDSIIRRHEMLDNKPESMSRQNWQNLRDSAEDEIPADFWVPGPPPPEEISLANRVSLILRPTGKREGIFQLHLNLTNGREIDLATEAGLPITFQNDAAMSYQRGKNEVHVNFGDIVKDPRRFFDVLHEIGHAMVDNGMAPEDVRAHNDAKTKMFWMRLAETIESRREIAERDMTPEQREVIIKNERDAWAAALRLSRTIREKYGVDLLERLVGSPEEQMRFLRDAGLWSYEAILEEDGESKRFLRNEK